MADKRKNTSSDYPDNSISTTTKKAKEKQFSWTDGEIQLLLETVKDYKTKQEYEGIDWMSVRTRFEDIRNLFVKSYPSTYDDEYPNSEETGLFSKDRLLVKLKTIRLNFKKALDSGRASGGGRVVACFYDLCREIWGGSPAVEKMGCGIDTSGVLDEDKAGDQRDDAVEEEENKEDDNSKTSACSHQASELTSNRNSCANRRQMLSDKLTDSRNKKLKKTIPFENQMLALAKDDAELRKNLVSQLKEGDKEHLEYIKSRDQEHSECMRNIGATMYEMSHCISSGFQLLSNLLQQQQSFMNIPTYQNIAPSQNTMQFPNMYQQQGHRQFGQQIQGQPQVFPEKPPQNFET